MESEQRLDKPPEASARSLSRARCASWVSALLGGYQSTCVISVRWRLGLPLCFHTYIRGFQLGLVVVEPAPQPVQEDQISGSVFLTLSESDKA